MSSRVIQWFRPAPPAPRLPPEEVALLYPQYRWRVFEAAFFAYAAFYIVRNNFSPVQSAIESDLHYTPAMLGNIISGTAIAYGIGKFVMGYFADRSDARKYLAVGMLLTAAFNFMFGSVSNYWAHLLLWTLNGFAQGMGYGPCTRGLSHWYSAKERGTVFGWWNISHNIGGGIAGWLAGACGQHWGWRSAFIVPGIIATLSAVYLFWRMRDTPQSVGLPAVEEYRNDWPPEEREAHERELTAREILLGYIFPNGKLWILAFANISVYVARYAMVDWGPYYLTKVKHASLTKGGLSTTVIEFAGALGMLTMGWLSDKIGGRRARVSVCAMIPLMFAFGALCFVPEGLLWLDMVLFGVIGFLVYVPVMFSGVMSLDLTSKKTVGTAAGFVGLFGYVGGRVMQGVGIPWVVEHYSWDAALWAIVGTIGIGVILLSFLWNVRPRG